ncbi:LPD38 domain-containing protein [Yersinia enterocolitica]|uniref:LPD38 domain-containing protein n=1 Tax=Yersinia enterocolitica TaxID=630 RepID=UPI00065A88CA|nr:LPD38 domain-containing protein [Yersinia enterocolitica]CRY31905.1 DNA repair ATPase [Yersinia enterocolitica]
MAYDPQQQRPEEQTTNSNRETLNIRQPGENANTGFDWGAVRAAREAAGRQSKAPQANDPGIGLKDVLLSAATAPTDIISGNAQLFKAGNQRLDDKASEYRSGEKKPLIDIPVSPEMLRVMQANSGNLLSRAGNAVIGGVGDLAQSASKEIKSNYSEGAKEAAAMDFITFERDKNKNVTGIKAGAGLFDKDAWMINAIPSISQMFLTASGAKLGANAVERMAEKGAYNRLIKVLPEEAARATAKETAQMAKRRAQVTGFVGVSTGTAQGQGGIDMREETNSIPFDQLLESTTFQKAFADIDSDPSNSSLTDTQKLTLARSQVAEQAANSVTADPRMLAINIAASTLGDHTLAKLLTKKMATKSVISSAATGTFAEGSTEFAQGASQRYVQNQQLINTAGQKIDPMKDVFETGANNAIVGGGIGMGAGTIGGIRGRRSAAETTPETPVDIEGSPVSENIDLSQQQEVTPQPENQTSPEVAVQQNSVSENGVPNSQIDDFRDTPAYLRQDPRVQGFADDSDVQRSLAEPVTQPTAQDLIQQQIESGEQGFTPDELAILQQADQIRAQRTARLPAPGNIHPGEGFLMPGPIQGDETQAGAAPQFTAGEQTRGQVYLPREQAEQQGAVRETHTYDGQTDPQAITDKNIIFAEGPATNPDEVQSGKAPQFEGGQRKDVRRFTEAMGAQSETAITDQRQRAGGVPIDARTEAYAKGETLGELRLHHGKPFPNEKVARFTKWAKMPGAVIEPVGDGFGVRLPAKSTDSGIASTKEGHIESGTPQGELRLHHGKPFPNEKVARFTKWAKMPGAVIEPVGDGFGVRLPPEPTTANTKTAPSNEGVVASGEQQVGELRLHLGKPFNSEKVAKYSKWGKVPGATIEPVGKGYGVRLPVPEPVGQAKNRDAKIDDFGEELKGAAKHKWGQLAESLKADHDIEEIKKQPLSKLFPHPDYTKMHENGIEPEKLALLAALRSFIPTKPGSPYKLNQWAEQVKGVRDLASSIINSHASVDDIKTIFRSKSSLRSAADTIDLISQFKPAQMAEASKYTIHSGHYTYFDGKSYPGGKTLYQLVAPRGVIANISAGSMAEILPKAKAFIETQLNSDKGEAAPKQAKLEIYTRRADKSVFIGYKGAMGVLPLKAGFKTPNEAGAYLAENRAEIEAKLDKLRKVSREEQRKATNEPRTGIERRKGNVTPEQFSDAFGFRGVQFGNYVEGPRRQSELNDAYDSLIDMAELLSVPTKALSLNGELGLAFGARGKGGTKAHYEPGQVVINLTKGNGAGSLAHEWFHALDNYFGTYDVHGEASGKRSSEFITDRKRPHYEFSGGKRQEIIHPVRQEVHDAFKRAVDKVTHSGMRERAALLDGGRSKAYWTTKLEMSARAFERYLLDKAQSKGITNDYLVNLRKADEHANPETYAYPTEAELNGGVRQAFDHLFQTLNTKPTDKGITFYSRKGTDIGKGNVISDTGHTAAGEKPTQGIRQGRAQVIADVWVRNLNGAAKIKVKVVQTQAEAAAMMPSGIPQEFGIVHAIYQPELSRVIVVADNITSDRELRAKLRHEVLAHHGLASVIGDVEYDRIMRVLHQTRDSKNKEIQDVWREVDKSYRNESLEMQANEFLAHMAERSELTGLGAMWDRFVSVLINALKKAGIMNASDISPTEIRNILRTVAGRFKKTAMYDGEQPGTREFDNTFSRSDALYSRTANPAMDTETNRKMGFNVEPGWFDKAKTFYGTVTSKDKTELKAWLKETGRKLNTKTFDGMAPLKYAEDAAGINDARSSAYIGARMAAGAGSVTAATLEHGLPRYNKAEGIVERQSGTGKEDALMGILDGLGNYRENFFKWIAGHRSERLMKEGKENNFNADEIAYMKTLNRGNEALFEGQKKKYDAFIKSILDLQQDMGLIDPESRAQWEDAWYLPYYREAENGEVKGPWTSKGIANQSSTVRKLKGSDLTIKDPIENLFNYVAKSVDASMKNEAMRRSVVNLADTGVLEVIESPNKMDFERIGKDVVKVFVDGQEKLVRVNDPELYRAFTMIDLERSNSTFMKAARQAKKVLTVSTTSMPDFIIRNFMRDSIHSWAINKDGFKPVTASWAGFKKALRTDDSLVDMMFAGATFGGGYSNVYDPASTAKTIRSVLRRKGYNDSQIQEFESSIARNSKEVMGKIEQGLHKYKNLSEAAENANRLATYEAAIKSGKSKAQAAFESRDLMDFSMMGASKIMINLSDMLPFFNARMQGLSKLGRGIKEDPREVLKRGGMITAASLALMALNWDDKRYEELQDWDKDTYWHVWIGDQHIRFPKPFEFGAIFGTLPERFVRALGGKDTGAKFGKLVAHNFMETMAFNPIPQVAMPIAEAYVNYDFFKGGPIENMADSNLMAGARYNDQTSLLMREIGEATNMSPKMLDHIVMGYTGSLGGYVMGATNLLMRNLKDYGETPAMRLDELPVIKSFFRGSDPAKSTQFTEDFYRMMTEANQINSTINSFRKQGRGDDANELIEENRGKLSQRQGLTATQKQVKALNAQIEMMRRDRILTADQKREKIDRLMATRNKLVQQAVESVNPYFNK